jgi:tetratricopeptide (TPR) repeat protein
MKRIKQQVDFDWSGADASFRRAAALEPGNPESERMAASSARMLGRFEEALQLARRAVDLDPLNADSWQSLGDTEYYAGQLDESATDYEKALELNPDVFPGNISLSRTYIAQGRAQDALSEIERVAMTPNVRLCMRLRTTRLVGKRGGRRIE